MHKTFPIEYKFDHSRQRCNDRYGVDITREEYDRMCAKIQGDKSEDMQCEHVVAYSKTYSLWKIRYKGRVFYPVYGKTRSCIYTFLDARWIKQHDKHNVAKTERAWENIEKIKNKYSIDITRQDYEYLVFNIKNNSNTIRNEDEFCFLFRESVSRSCWCIKINGANLFVIYSKRLKDFCEILPKNFLESKEFDGKQLWSLIRF